MVSDFNVHRVIPQLATPMKKTRGDSVLGASHDLRIVGSAATWSATTKEISATVGWLTKAQKTRPAKEIEPQTTSKVPIRQTPWGLKNETTTMTQGTSPSINVVSDASPMCCWISMTKASTPSSPHSDHVTRWGEVTPRSVSRM